MISAMNFGSKVRSFLKKLRRTNNLKYYYFRYQRLIEQHIPDDDGGGGGIAGAPRIYVSALVGEEAKSYDVPLMYLSLPWFQRMMIRSSQQGTDLGRPIIVDCTPEMFELFLELWSFKWDYDEGNYFMFLKKFDKWNRVRAEYLNYGNAIIKDEMSNSSSDSFAEF